VLVVFAWVAPWLSASCTIPIKTGPDYGGQANFSRFTADKLLDFLKRIDQKVTINNA